MDGPGSTPQAGGDDDLETLCCRCEGGQAGVAVVLPPVALPTVVLSTQHPSNRLDSSGNTPDTWRLSRPRRRRSARDTRDTRGVAPGRRSRPWAHPCEPLDRPATCGPRRDVRRAPHSPPGRPPPHGTRRRGAAPVARPGCRDCAPTRCQPCTPPPRTRTRIAACGTTRYVLASNVISTAALRKNNA